MKESGLSTGALVAIVVGVVVAVVVPVTIAAFLLTGEGGSQAGSGTAEATLAAIPVYLEAQDTGMSIEQVAGMYGTSLPAGWTGKLYTTSASSENVISWYKTQMSGWTKTMENTIPYESGGVNITIYALGYVKGNDGAIIETFSVTGYGNYLILMAGPKPT